MSADVARPFYCFHHGTSLYNVLHKQTNEGSHLSTDVLLFCPPYLIILLSVIHRSIAHRTIARMEFAASRPRNGRPRLFVCAGHYIGRFRCKKHVKCKMATLMKTTFSKKSFKSRLHSHNEDD